eukprot:2756981-Prymnesium_polylepis.3
MCASAPAAHFVRSPIPFAAAYVPGGANRQAAEDVLEMSGLYRPAAAARRHGKLRECVDKVMFRGPDRISWRFTADARRVARAALDAEMSLNARTGAQHVRLAWSGPESTSGARCRR